jgi:hypothetical protein
MVSANCVSKPMAVVRRYVSWLSKATYKIRQDIRNHTASAVTSIIKMQLVGGPHI